MAAKAAVTAGDVCVLKRCQQHGGQDLKEKKGTKRKAEEAPEGDESPLEVCSIRRKTAGIDCSELGQGATPATAAAAPPSWSARLIVPSGFDIAATVSNSHRSPSGHITRVLTEARGFNVAASLLEASGVTDDFEADERGARITIFALLAQGTSLHATSNAGSSIS